MTTSVGVLGRAIACPPTGSVGAAATGARELDSSAAAKYLGVCRSTLYEYCSLGALAFRDVAPPNRKRRRFRFLVSDLEAFRGGQTCGAADPVQPASLATTALGTIARSYPLRVAKQLGSLRCHCCAKPFRPTRYPRIAATTRLEEFLSANGISVTPLVHKLRHVEKHLGVESPRLFSVQQLLSLRRGITQPTVIQAETIRLAVADLLETPVSLVDLFDLTQVRTEL